MGTCSDAMFMSQLLFTKLMDTDDAGLVENLGSNRLLPKGVGALWFEQSEGNGELTSAAAMRYPDEDRRRFGRCGADSSEQDVRATRLVGARRPWCVRCRMTVSTRYAAE